MSYDGIDLDTKLVLEVRLAGRHGTDPAVAVLHGLRETHDCSDATFLVDQFGYRTGLARLGSNDRVGTLTETASERSFKASKYTSAGSTTRGWAVGRAPASGLDGSSTTTTTDGRIDRSTEGGQPTKCETTQWCPTEG